MFNKENAIEFRKFMKKEGGAESFKRNFIRDPLHSSNVDKLINCCRFTGYYLMDRDQFVDNILDVLPKIIDSCLIYKVGTGEPFLDPDTQRMHTSILEIMYDGMRDDRFMGVLAATIGAWIACNYIGSNIEIDILKKISTEDVRSPRINKLMRDQWEYMEPVMKLQLIVRER